MTAVTAVLSEKFAQRALKLLAKYIDDASIPKNDADAFYELGQLIIEGINKNKLRERLAEIQANRQHQ